jgi:hypothetical protein
VKEKGVQIETLPENLKLENLNKAIGILNSNRLPSKNK